MPVIIKILNSSLKKTYYRIMIFNLIQSVFGALPKLTSIKTIHYTYCTCARVMEYIAFNV